MKLFVICVCLFSAMTAHVRADDAGSDEETICKSAMDLLSAGKQSDAEKIVFTRAREHPSNRMYFFAAVLVRSRFEVSQADRIFAEIATDDPKSIEGQTAALVSAIDIGWQTEQKFKDLDDLSAAHSDNPLILWMVAVECRQLHKPRLGIERYASLLKAFNPGPALMHQTYGNLLLDVQQAHAALEQYQIAIQMEPACWDYNCEGNAFMALRQFDDAAAAYKKSTDLDPDYQMAWSNWALLCDAQHDAAGAAEKRAKVAEIEARHQQNPKTAK